MRDTERKLARLHDLCERFNALEIPVLHAHGNSSTLNAFGFARIVDLVNDCLEDERGSFRFGRRTFENGIETIAYVQDYLREQSFCSADIHSLIHLNEAYDDAYGWDVSW
jgi:hypothetical protein